MLALVGCGDGLMEVRGKVTYNGKPVENGVINFEREDKSGPTRGGPITNREYRLTGTNRMSPGPKVARIMASKRVSPKGVGSGIRMIQLFINRAGKTLPARQRRELEKAKRILQERRATEQGRARTTPARRRAA